MLFFLFDFINRYFINIYSMKLTKKKIIDVVSKCTKTDPKNISENTSTENLQAWDSLAHVRIMIELKDLTGINIPTSDFGNFNSVSSILKKFT